MKPFASIGALFCVITVLDLPLTLAHESFLKEIPNGSLFEKALGHNEKTKEYTPFGEDFKKAGNKWSKKLCEMQFPSAGMTYGEAFGDPCCVWKKGDQPAFEVAPFTDTPGKATTCNDKQTSGDYNEAKDKKMDDTKDDPSEPKHKDPKQKHKENKEIDSDSEILDTLQNGLSFDDLASGDSKASKSKHQNPVVTPVPTVPTKTPSIGKDTVKEGSPYDKSYPNKNGRKRRSAFIVIQSILHKLKDETVDELLSGFSNSGPLGADAIKDNDKSKLSPDDVKKVIMDSEEIDSSDE